jgi:thioredoxin reductase (NADPH)
MIAVIGSGPAGVSTALYLKRANKDVVVFTNHKSSLLKAKEIENYYGTGKINGNKLYQDGLSSLNDLNIELIEEEVFNIDFGNKLILETNKNKYEFDVIVLATGASKNKPKLKNIEKFEGTGISYCATCDGFFFRNKKIAVLGNSDFALHELNYLKNISSDLFLLTNGDSLESEFITYNNKIKELVGETSLEKIIFEDNTELLIDALFIANDSPDSNVLAKKCGILTDKSGIVVNDKFETNVPGIYACGDAVKGQKQIAKAVYEGMVAGMDASKYVRNLK